MCVFVCVCVCVAASNRQQLVTAGVIPVLIRLLQSQDEDVQYYSAAAISNLAVDGTGIHWPCCIGRVHVHTCFYHLKSPCLHSVFGIAECVNSV